MDDKNNEKLLDRIEYYMEYPADEEKIDMMFSTGEKNILRTIREFEKIRYEMKWKNEKPVSKEDNAKFIEEVFRNKEKERDISFQLKKEFTDWIDVLLEQGRIEAWLDILTWYRLLKGKNLIVDKFWEFPVLETMLNSLEELTDVYFHLVFLLRRVEYELEPADEILDYLIEKKISLTVTDVVLDDARIFDEEKVRRTIIGWVENGNERT